MTMYICGTRTNSGAFLVAEGDNIKILLSGINKQEEIGKGLWILIDKKDTKTELGIIYGS